MLICASRGDVSLGAQNLFDLVTQVVFQLSVMFANETGILKVASNSGSLL